MFYEPWMPIISTFLIGAGIFILVTANGGSCGYTVGSFCLLVGILFSIRLFKKKGSGKNDIR